MCCSVLCVVYVLCAPVCSEAMIERDVQRTRSGLYRVFNGTLLFSAVALRCCVYSSHSINMYFHDHVRSTCSTYIHPASLARKNHISCQTKPYILQEKTKYSKKKQDILEEKTRYPHINYQIISSCQYLHHPRSPLLLPSTILLSSSAATDDRGRSKHSAGATNGKRTPNTFSTAIHRITKHGRHFGQGQQFHTTLPVAV